MSVQNKALLRAISEDRALGSAMLFAHRHEYPTPDFHVQMMDLWRSADEMVLIEAFREGAKTTLAEEFLCMEALYGNFFYCVIFGETYTKACQKIEAIAYEARTNHKIGKLFGDPLAKKPVENKIHFKSGALIEGAGWEQEITGFKYLDRRPDRAYLDDVENLERVRSSEAVDQTMRKLYSEVLPALDKVRRKIRITETPRAADCMVTRLRSNQDWLCASFPICVGDVDDPKTVSAWPARYPMAWIRAERDKYERAGMLRVFQQEFLLTVDTTEAKPFAEEMLRSVDVAPAAWLPRKAIYDPARTANAGTSARTGKVVVSRLGSKVIVHESAGNFWKPDEIRTDVFATWERHHCSEIGIEKDSLDEFLLQPIRYECLRRGVVVPIRALNAPQDRDKDQFIMGLQPFFTAGDIILVGGRGMHAQLVAEILNFPGGRRDTLNALAYALRMFSGQPVYEDFGEANVGPAREVGVGEKLTTCWNASATEVVCAVLMRSGRHFTVSRDFAAGGPTSDAVRQILADLRAHYPKARVDAYVPSELHDAWQRIPLVPALRGERLTPFRGEHTVIARGSLADAIRTTIKERRLLTVAKDAPRTLAALAGDYRFEIGKTGAQAQEPAPGIYRLVGEALECAYATLARGFDEQADSGRHYARNANGVRYQTAMPTRRS
jgi:hypothetical protein